MKVSEGGVALNFGAATPLMPVLNNFKITI